MVVVMTFRHLAIAALLLALIGCERPKVYSLAPGDAQSALVGTAIPGMAFGMTMLSTPGRSIPGGVEWRLRPNSADFARPGSGAEDGKLLVLMANLTPVANGTRVEVSVLPTARTNKDTFARAMADHPAWPNYFKTVASEQIDACLNHRNFDLANVRLSMIAALASIRPQVNKQMDEDTKAFQQRDRDAIDNAYQVAR